MALTITLTLSRGSQSITGNYTNVSWSLTYSKSSTTYNNNGVSYYVNIAGTRVKTGTVKFPKGTTSGTIATGSRAISWCYNWLCLCRTYRFQPIERIGYIQQYKFSYYTKGIRSVGK